MKRGVVRALGWLAIAHGLSHAVPPLRGALAPAILIGDWTPLVLYTVSLIGFVAAGLGLLGLRPLDLAISPLLVLASALSIVAIQRIGHADLWLGGVFDVAFFLLGLWRASAGWPAFARPLLYELRRGRPVQGREDGRVWHVLGLTFGFAFLGYVTTATMLWPWHRTWGTTRAEVAMSLPGDRPMRDPAFEIQHAVTIEAAAADVWSRLVQLARNDARQLSVIEEGRAILLRDGGVLVLLPADERRTRLIIRTPIGEPTIREWAAAIDYLAFQLPYFVRERRTIEALAEQHVPIVTSAR